jgi:predicted regulator of Ras-like GTPase activity (Roadblock/LC7/MglB family)
MEKELAQIAQVPSVGGAFVCSNAGDVIVSSTPPVLATVTMNAIGREMARAFTAFEASGRPVTRLEVTYDTWRLLASDMGDLLMFVVCHPGVDAAVVRMTVDVVGSGWQKDSRVQKRLAPYRTPRRAAITPNAMDERSQHAWRLIEQRA